MAITAWSAKVVHQLDLLFGERVDTVLAATKITPIGSLRAAVERRAWCVPAKLSNASQMYSGSLCTSCNLHALPSSDRATDDSIRVPIVNSDVAS